MVSPAPLWTLLSALAAPLTLSLGMWLGALHQDAVFDSTVDTISALAGLTARDRWIMTGALGLLGVCHITTALGLRAAAPLGRGVLALGGLSILLVAAFPLSAQGVSREHALSALAAFVSMCAWPLFAWRQQTDITLLRMRASVVASLSLFALLAWFGLAIRTDHFVGLSERVVAIAQALWPLLVVLWIRRAQRMSAR